MLVRVNHAKFLSLMPGLSNLRNARNVSQRPYVPGYLLLSGDAVDDGAIPSYAPRHRVSPIHFTDVLVPENAGVEEMKGAIRRQILC
jgi:hypothetical protein